MAVQKTAATRAAAVKAMNMALANMPMAKAELGEITLENWGTWTTQFLNGRYENMFYAYLTDVILQQFVSKANFENPLKRYKKGFVSNGAGVRQRFIDKIDALPYTVSDVEKRELKTYLANIYEADYIVNTQRYYPVTLGRVEFRGAVATPDGVLDLIDTIKSMLYTSNEIDEYAMMQVLIQNHMLQGRAFTVPVDMSVGLTARNGFAQVYRAFSLKMSRPSRRYNEFGVMNNAPINRQVLWLTDSIAAAYSVEVLSSAFNMSQVDYTTNVEVIDSFDTVPVGYKELQAAMPGQLPAITAGDLAVLKNVVAVLMDEDLLQIYDYINELWEKERAVMMDINYFLHVWQIFGISPFANMIVFVDAAAGIVEPTTITMKVVGKNVRSGRTSFHLVVKRDDPSLVGGAINLLQTDEDAENQVRVFRNGYVEMPSNSAGTTLTGVIREAEYTAAAALTPAANVGDTITFNVNAA